jgi:hypothetical protein
VSESPEQPTKRRWVWKALLGIFALGGAVVLADWWSVQPRGSEVPKSMLELMVLVGIPPLVLLFVLWGLLLLVISRNIARAKARFAAAFFFLLAFVAFAFACRVGHVVRTRGFEVIAVSGAPLIDAIEAYIADHAVPPDSLDELVPDYLNEIPRTGLAAYPEFIYYWYRPDDYWRVFVPVGSALEWTQMVYSSSGQYGRSWQRIGPWAIVLD